MHAFFINFHPPYPTTVLYSISEVNKTLTIAMSTSALTPAPQFQPLYLDDESSAISLQLEEFQYREDTKRAKYSAQGVPDLELAYAAYLQDMENQLAFLKDAKLAHSIANAVDTDAAEISSISHAETQAQEDHEYAMRLSSGDPGLKAPPPYTESGRAECIVDEAVRRIAALLVDVDAVQSSVTYVARNGDSVDVHFGLSRTY